MPPAFNLSQDQTLQFNPSFAPTPNIRGPAAHSKQFTNTNYLRVSYFIYQKLLRKAACPAVLSKTPRPGDNPPSPRKRPNTRSTHTHRLFEFLKSDAVTGGRFRRRCALYGSESAGQHFSGDFAVGTDGSAGPRIAPGVRLRSARPWRIYACPPAIQTALFPAI